MQMALTCLQVSTLLQAPFHPWATTSRGPTHQGPTLALGVTQPQ
ncbi:cell death inducing p53 target 1 [Phyllostomus discolor]|uniref:Cell death inducing p53 target 1 n=1 Tax=Phyllostomus discolor TaxID=89673 RepID=A0A834B3C6_9CHIR|nr:cell death inducing p53 target 1 [Phyllostomus discolor]